MKRIRTVEFLSRTTGRGTATGWIELSSNLLSGAVLSSVVYKQRVLAAHSGEPPRACAIRFKYLCTASVRRDAMTRRTPLLREAEAERLHGTKRRSLALRALGGQDAQQLLQLPAVVLSHQADLEKVAPHQVAAPVAQPDSPLLESVSQGE